MKVDRNEAEEIASHLEAGFAYLRACAGCPYINPDLAVVARTYTVGQVVERAAAYLRQAPAPVA